MPKHHIRPLPKLTKEQYTNFWNKVAVRNDKECWLWLGSKNEHGYGGVRINYQLFKASRVAYMIGYKKDPMSMHVLHRCDNPPCVNPSHLFLGTIKDNAEDSVKKGRSKILYKCGDANQSRTCPDKVARGNKLPHAKLTPNKVIEIRNLYAEGISQHKLAKEYGVDQSVISEVVRRLTWRHIA